jgi:hypothetical protein
MKLGAFFATLLLTSAVGGCGESDTKKAIAPPASSNSGTSTPSAPSVTAACDLVGTETAHVTLAETGEKLVLTFMGASISKVGTTGYFATVFDEPGDNGAQLGITFRDGAPESYFVFDSGAAHQTNLEGEAEVQGDMVVGTFPKASENLGDFDVAQWNAALTRNGNDIAGCPDLNGDEFLQPFPG